MRDQVSALHDAKSFRADVDASPQGHERLRKRRFLKVRPLASRREKHDLVIVVKDVCAVTTDNFLAVASQSCCLVLFPQLEYGCPFLIHLRGLATTCEDARQQGEQDEQWKRGLAKSAHG